MKNTKVKQTMEKRHIQTEEEFTSVEKCQIEDFANRYKQKISDVFEFATTLRQIEEKKKGD